MAERFIPLRYKEVVQGLSRDFFAGNEKDFQLFVRRFEDLVEYEAGELEEEVKELYYPFSPDEDTITLQEKSPDELGRQKTIFYEKLDHLFDKANFSRVSEEELHTALKDSSMRDLDLKVDLGSIEDLRLYYRGIGEIRKCIRMYASFFRSREVCYPTYKRVAVAVKLKGSPRIYIKLFKNIPKIDLDALMPEVKVKMKSSQLLKLGGSSGSALYSGAKMTTKGMFLVGKSFLLPLLLLVGSVYGGKTLWNYKKAKDNHQAQLGKYLFYHNMDNNTGVITRIIDALEESECMEAVLAYAFLRREGSTREGLKGKIEEYLRSTYDLKVDFDIDDALDKLQKKKLAWKKEDGFEVVELKKANKLLAERWAAILNT